MTSAHGVLGVFDLSGKLTSAERQLGPAARMAKLHKPRPRPVVEPKVKYEKLIKALNIREQHIDELDRYIQQLERIIEEDDEDLAAFREGAPTDLADVVRAFLVCRSARYPGVQRDIAALLEAMDRLTAGPGV